MTVSQDIYDMNGRKLLTALVWILTPVAVLGYIISPGILYGLGQRNLLAISLSVSLAASFIVLTAISLLRIR